MFGRARLVIGVTAAALAMPSVAAANEEITVASLTSWPPFSGKELPNKGFSNDVAKTVLERAGYDVTVKLMPWSRAKKMTERGKFEVLTSVWHNEKRAKTLAFTDAIARNELVFISRKGSGFTYTGLDSLKGMTVGTVRGYDYQDAFLDTDHFQREAAESFKTNLKKLAAGRIDAAVGDRLIGKYLVSNKLSSLKGELAYSDKALSSKKLYVTVSRKAENTEQLVSDFNAALKAIRADGTYTEIQARHGLQ
ncbi:amino acid ABC transporter substrate-binding protein, PAAT family [Limimonas halophila]|uniref:Amino acid ABC transporter substrate-binding protein, PAAT family n=1 Tax=Limimonas halophila TaxID=1082479 RepID=A0A1G7M676_9PROT|nr:transporter substrate-binding domain-containing protein [Limimonas halophila]SDF57211.1 amino acid ABC transporter substrate-binding protein, PAAT family [Limimonas halophila]